MRYCLLVFFCSLFACGSDSSSKAMNDMYASQFCMTDSLCGTFNGKDTVVANVLDAPLRLIVYMDSTKCASCAVSKMEVTWGKYIKMVKASDNRFSICFILYPGLKKNETSAKIALKSYPIDYPVYIDRAGSFERKNPHLPKDSRFHTFLVDSVGKVLFVGSPVGNEKLEQLFFKTLTEELRKK